jgi:hypothetical protein
MAREMDLKMKIMARGEQALSMFNKVQIEIAKTGKILKEANELKSANALSGFLGRIRSDLGGIASIGGKVANVFFAPLRIAAAGASALSVVIGGLAAKSLAAAAADEKLEQQLIAVYGSVAEGKKVFAEAESTARRSWVPTEEIAAARIVMKGFGLDTERNLGAMSNAARAAKQSVSEMATAVSVLQLRHLKKLGIEVGEKDGRFVATWRNQLGQVQKITVKTADEMRAKLMDVFAMKFGVSMRPQDLSEFWAMFKNNVDQAFAPFGRPLLDVATRFVDFLAGKLRGLIESGKLEEMGKKLAKWIEDAAVKAQAIFEEARDIFKAIKEQGWDAMAEAFQTIAGGVGQIIAVSLVNYIQAASGIFMAIGRLMAAPFIEEILKLLLKIPFTRGQVLKAFSGEAWASPQLKKFGKFGYSSEAEFAAGGQEVLGHHKEIGAGMLKDSVGFFRNELPRIRKETTGAISNIVQTTAGRLKDIGGYTGPSLEEREAAIRDKKKQILMSVSSYRRPSSWGENVGGKTVWGPDEYSQDMTEAPFGAEPGLVGATSARNGIRKIITNVFIRKSDLERTRNDMKKAGWSPALSLAGG